MIKYITSIAVVGCTLALSTAPSFAEKISLDRLNAYLNDLPVVKASFTQINSDRSKSKGQLYLNRPGRMRFEYAAPNKALVIASAGSLAVYDDKTRDGPSIYPLKKTPLSLILGKNINLKSNGMVAKHVESGEHTIVIARDPKNPKQGHIQLVFTDNPVALRQWVITDQSKQKTTILLGKLREQKKLSSRLFEIKRPDRDE
jgi:outer membrane lipoprotein-sorting protein